MADTSAGLSLAVNDRVVYPNQGVCVVSAIETKAIAGQSLVFVTLKREEDGAVVMVPKTKLAAIGVRKVAGPADASAVFAFLRSDSQKADLDWKQRARTNADRMTSGGVLGLAEVVKGLAVLSELRPLPNKERELYDDARHLLVVELASALKCNECDSEDALDIALFPPGVERPKRTAAEFRQGDELDELGFSEGLEFGEEGEVEPPVEPEAEGEPPAKVAVRAEAAVAPPKRGKGKKAAPPPIRLSDDDTTQPMGDAAEVTGAELSSAGTKSKGKAAAATKAKPAPKSGATSTRKAKKK